MGNLSLDEAYKNYWENVYKSGKFLSTVETNALPWDINSYDQNLKDILDWLNLNQGEILELGCGFGNDSKFLAERGFNVTSIDISENAINISKENTKGLNIEFILGDIFKDLPNHKFDFVYDRGFFHNYKNDYEKIFTLISNVLKTCGKFILITGNPNQIIIDTCMPPHVYLGEIEHCSQKFFKIIFVKEIIFETNKNYQNCLGYIFLLERI